MLAAVISLILSCSFRVSEAGRNLHVRAEDPALLGVVRALLRPVELAAFDVHGDADAPLRRIRPGAGIALARVDEGLDVGAIEVGAHHAHPLPIAPVELFAL